MNQDIVREVEKAVAFFAEIAVFLGQLLLAIAWETPAIFLNLQI